MEQINTRSVTFTKYGYFKPRWEEIRVAWKAHQSIIQSSGIGEEFPGNLSMGSIRRLEKPTQITYSREEQFHEVL